MDIIWLLYVVSVWLVALGIFIVIAGLLFIYLMQKADDWRR